MKLEHYIAASPNEHAASLLLLKQIESMPVKAEIHVEVALRIAAAIYVALTPKNTSDTSRDFIVDELGNKHYIVSVGDQLNVGEGFG